MKKKQERRAKLVRENKSFYLEGIIDKFSVPELWKDFLKIKEFSEIESIDLSKVEELDSAGTLFIEELAITVKSKNGLDAPFTDLIVNFTEDFGKILKVFSQIAVKDSPTPEKESFFEKAGETVLSFFAALFDSMVLSADVFYWSFVGLWNKKGARKGSFIQQSLLIGNEAVPIVGLLSFIIGLILALQAAAQLRMFGADIFIADMLGYAMLTEMGALMTAIIVAGRSGSAIASEIATMKVSEELDALKMMSINPIRYVIVPKFYAMTICMPLLVVMSIIVGIIGGLLIAVFYLNLSVSAFYNQLVNVLLLKHFVTTMIKSTFFGWAIVIIGSFYGLKVEGGAEGVGKATTMSVVASIFTVILIDVIFSLLYLP